MTIIADLAYGNVNRRMLALSIGGSFWYGEEEKTDRKQKW